MALKMRESKKKKERSGIFKLSLTVKMMGGITFGSVRGGGTGYSWRRKKETCQGGIHSVCVFSSPLPLQINLKILTTNETNKK